MPEPKRITRHICKCCEEFLTGIRVDTGDVPYWIRCEACGVGIMTPAVVSQSAAPDIEWYRPATSELIALPPFKRMLVEDGLLLQRPLKVRESAPV